MVRKGKPSKQKHGYDHNIDDYENQKRKLEKPKLDTNFHGSIDKQQSK
jgi:hypothetical protein